MMARRYSLLVAVVLLLLIAGSARAQQPPTLDELKGDIQTLKDASDPTQRLEDRFDRRFDMARHNLVRYPELSLALVIGLLDENDLQMRLNGAIALAGIARSKYTHADLVPALRRCLGDSNPSVVYWGLRGMAEGQVPRAELIQAVIKCLDTKQPVIVRLVAADTAADNGLKETVPWLIERLKTLAPSYEEQVRAKLTVKKGAAAVNPAVAPLPGPGLVPIVAPGDPRKAPAAVIVEDGTRMLDPEKITSDEALERLAADMLSMPAILELHHVGLVIESLARENQADQPFGKEASFEANPPWRLRPCIDAAVAWFERNREEFPEGPRHETPPATVPEPPAEPPAPVVEPEAPAEGGPDAAVNP